jgi:hypothetical protein
MDTLSDLVNTLSQLVKIIERFDRMFYRVKSSRRVLKRIHAMQMRTIRSLYNESQINGEVVFYVCPKLKTIYVKTIDLWKSIKCYDDAIRECGSYEGIKKLHGVQMYLVTELFAKRCRELTTVSRWY